MQQAGFDASLPTAWSAEGLLRYLPAQAQDLLLERVNALSPCDSRLAVNAPAKSAWDPDLNARRREESQRVRAVMSRVLDTEMPDLDDLWYPEERTDVTYWLGEHGWDASATTMAEMLSRYGRDVPGDDRRPPTDFVSARRL